MIGKDVVFDDGVFEVTLIKNPKNPIELQEIMAALLIEQIDTRHMYTFRAKKVLFESEEEVAWTMDGEYGGSHKEVEIENMQKALKIMVPKDYVEDLSEVKENEK